MDVAETFTDNLKYYEYYVLQTTANNFAKCMLYRSTLTLLKAKWNETISTRINNFFFFDFQLARKFIPIIDECTKFYIHKADVVKNKHA